MAKSVTFDGLEVVWGEFRFDTSSPGHYLLRAFGIYHDSETGTTLPREASGWTGISANTKAAVETALTAALFERAAAALEIESGDGLVLSGTTIRVAAVGETPAWTKP